VEFPALPKDVEIPGEPAKIFTKGGKRVSTGVIMVEEDGRIWIISPTGEYGGYKNTFPKGTLTEGLSQQANAIKEVWEETGLQSEILGYLGEYEKGSSYTRYYIGRRIGGNPTLMAEETEAVKLAPMKDLKLLLNKEIDQTIADDLIARYSQALKAGEGDWKLGISRLADDFVYKAKYEEFVADPIIKDAIKDMVDKLQKDYTWQMKLETAESMATARARSSLDLWSGSSGTTEFKAMEKLGKELKGENSIADYRKVKELAAKMDSEATEKIGSFKLGAVEEYVARSIKKDISPAIRLERIEARSADLIKESEEAIKTIMKEPDGSVERFLLEKLSKEKTFKDDWELLTYMRERKAGMLDEAYRTIDKFKEELGETFIDIEIELSKEVPGYVAKTPIERAELIKAHGARLSSKLDELEKLLSESKMYGTYASEVDLTAGVEKKIETLKGIIKREAERKAALETLSKTEGISVEAEPGLKKLKDLSEADMRTIYGPLKKTLVGGKIPGSETKMMKVWRTLESSERKRMIDLWVSKGIDVPVKFIDDWYPKGGGIAPPAPKPKPGAAPKSPVGVKESPPSDILKSKRLKLGDFVQYQEK
jgi:ADP-ribose pyrophosphatase YjhB (NUDIX family)